MAKAQIELKYAFPNVVKNGNTLDLAFAGGLNSPQFQEIDIDRDGDMDLMIFDRSSEMVVCFENTGTDYEFNPYFAAEFPNDLQHWVVLADYDCDGDQDLFTYATAGVRVFENVNTGTERTWALAIEPLKTEGLSGQINVLFNATDISSIADLDGDGDLDFLYFNFANGDFIEWHKNYSVEQTGTCGLHLVRESTQYGQIEVCGCDEFGFNGNSCHAGSKTLHQVAKALLSIDQNQNGVMDLVVSQEGCPNLSFLPNVGTNASPDFSSFDSGYPSFSSEINFPSFPAAFYLDVTFDGKKDLVVSQNIRSDEDGESDLSQSSFVFENQSTNSFATRQSFLQDQMIDVGASAYPDFVDIDGDGLEDLVIANKGSIVDGEFTASVAYYRQTASGFVYETDDLFNISSLGFTHLKIQFIDLNQDEVEDLVFSALDENENDVFGYFIGQKETSSLLFDIQDMHTFPFNLDESSDFLLYDMDEDGLLDLLEANVFGELNYYRNVSTTFDFVLDQSDLLALTPSANNASLSIIIGDLDDDGLDDLVTTRRNGQMAVYLDFPANTDEPISELIQYDYASTGKVSDFGRRSKPVIGMLNDQKIVLVGTIAGGVNALTANSQAAVVKLDAYPNPATDNIMTFQISNGSGYLQILDLTGRSVSQLFNISSENAIELDLTYLNSGLYLAHVHINGKSITRRIQVIAD